MKAVCVWIGMIWLAMVPALLWGQRIEPGTFFFPIKPGERNYLSGSMGEIRGAHFHAGLDIKTDRVVGLPVHATQQGYIYRINISPWGYGRAVYMRHPNGLISVYAHLQKFAPELEEWTINQQYAKESFSVNLYPPKGKFAFAKGEIIAYSGNSGSSSAPHLHFEIRNQYEIPLDPMEAEFEEVVDTRPPHINRVAVVTRAPEARILGRHGRADLPVIGQGDQGRVLKSIRAYGRVGLEFQGHDLMDATSNVYGIKRVEVLINGQLHYQHEITAVPFHLKRRVHVFMDEAYRRARQRTFQRCYVADGNTLDFYPQGQGDGTFRVAHGQTYQVEMRFYDSRNNRATVKLRIEGDRDFAPLGSDYRYCYLPNFHLFENTMLIQARTLTEPAIVTTKTGEQIAVPPAYQVGEYSGYLYDMRRGLPRQIRAGDLQRQLAYHAMAPSGRDFNFWGGWVDVQIPKGALYDTLYLTLAQEGNQYLIGDPHTPLDQHITITLKNIKPDNKAMSSVYRIVDGRPRFEGGTWKQDQITFRTRDMGTFQIFEDGEAPKIRTIRANSQQAVFRISDNLSGIDTYRAELDGQFVLMEYDPQAGTVSTRLKPGQDQLHGKLTLIVTDGQGNTATQTVTL